MRIKNLMSSTGQTPIANPFDDHSVRANGLPLIIHGPKLAILRTKRMDTPLTQREMQLRHAAMQSAAVPQATPGPLFDKLTEGERFQKAELRVQVKVDDKPPRTRKVEPGYKRLSAPPDHGGRPPA